ncbi:hypothetical protein B0A50_07593 [Salinomyces thailandicus]|uniref:Autophagy-related protein 16 domain-containing protein n=1 Tax=Salinomyces thailandicus TaxID=706561 RepID=A0A4U0TML3_9PEZI|nr:hypothetical protein B0A50_07593 [Salinomyces thailandica]
MSDWIEQYSAALTERDAREQAHKPYLDAYTKLADRTAALEINSRPSATVPPSSSPQPEGSNKARSEAEAIPTRTKSAASKTTDQQQPSNDLLASLRTDLATTQKARTALQTQVDELTSALNTQQAQTRTSTTQTAQLSRQKAELERKVRDRDEELRGKSRMVEHAQDEMVALGLQLNLAEEKQEKLTRENKELVDRWMARMGEEVDRVNRDSRWT